MAGEPSDDDMKKVVVDLVKPNDIKASDLEPDAPTDLDGNPVDKDEAARVHQALLSGEMKMCFAPEALAEMEEAGITPEMMKEMFLASLKKTMS